MTPKKQQVFFQKLIILRICIYFNSNYQVPGAFPKYVDNTYDSDMKKKKKPPVMAFYF